MEPMKKASNLTFSVNYDDGEKRHVEEGVLFEFEGNNINLHIGTERIECIFSIVEATIEAIESFGLAEVFHKYLEQNRGNQPEVEVAQ